MKTYFWMMFFLGIFLFSLLPPHKLSQKIVENVLPVQKKNIDLANITPICLDRSNIPKEELHWLYMPKNPSELATSEYYGYLSGQLIMAGVVNTSDCPLNGLWPTGYANTCGMEKTRAVSLYLQNVYDDEILAAGKAIGVPPVMIKQLIRYESQFWPVQMGFYHFGLGHLTYLGASNALTWNRALLYDVSTASQLLSMMDASCSTCSLKIDIPKAEKSITYIAGVLLGYCSQTSQVVYNATEKNAANVVDYATIWKLTLLNYNVGPSCVYNAIRAAYRSDKTKPTDKLSWDVISRNIEEKACERGVSYVENITGPYYDFGTNP